LKKGPASWKAPTPRRATPGALEEQAMTIVRTLVPSAAAALGLLVAALPLPAICQADPAGAAPPAVATSTAVALDPMVVTPDTAPPAQVAALAGGDNRVVTNGPVADTAANRAKFGGPLSRSGRKTRAAGN
jgi:hypothetical protein